MDMDLVDFAISWPLPLELDDQHLQDNKLGEDATQLNTIIEMVSAHHIQYRLARRCHMLIITSESVQALTSSADSALCSEIYNVRFFLHVLQHENMFLEPGVAVT